MGQGKKDYQDPIPTFKRLFGVKPKIFAKMNEILQKEYGKMHRKGGSPPKLSIENKLMVTLKYLREYRTMEHIGYDYGVSKSTVCESIQRVDENTLKKDGTFKMPGKKVLKEEPGANEFIAADVTESPIQRPKKQKAYYSGEKKRHTIKTQVIIERKSRSIIDVQQAKGGVHDFKIYKDTIGKAVNWSIGIDTDLGILE